MRSSCFAVTSCVTVVLLMGQSVGADWPEWRGPRRDGTTAEKNLPAAWSPAGDNLAWKAPYGGRSGPVVFGDRVYLHTAVGTGDAAQERVVALDANTGKLLWEHRQNVFHSDVPAHRGGWAAPSVDPASGVIYSFGAGGLLTALTPAGKVQWQRSLSEEFGLISTHGGRTVSPIVEDNLVIVNALCVGWGDLGRGGNRWFAFDKSTGVPVWISSPQKKHYDTNMSPGIVTTVDGMKLLVVGGTDGTFHALKVHTGEQVWEFEISKRAILTGAVLNGSTAYLTHSEENLDTSEMGMIAALNVGATGTLARDKNTVWFNHGFQGGFASPVTDGERSVRRRQRRDPRGVRPEGRPQGLGEDSGHDSEELAGARRRQALRRHRERQVLHPEALRDRRRGAGRRLAGQRADTRAGVPDRRRCPAAGSS